MQLVLVTAWISIRAFFRILCMANETRIKKDICEFRAFFDPYIHRETLLLNCLIIYPRYVKQFEGSFPSFRCRERESG